MELNGKHLQCSDCVYYEEDSSADHPQRECRRMPPVAAGNKIPDMPFETTFWPTVLDIDWCGEWRDTLPVVPEAE